MTLKQKFKNSPDVDGFINPNESRAENNVKIADEYAICFHDWAKNCKAHKSEKTIELLKMFKEKYNL